MRRSTRTVYTTKADDSAADLPGLDVWMRLGLHGRLDSCSLERRVLTILCLPLWPCRIMVDSILVAMAAIVKHAMTPAVGPIEAW